MNAGSWWGIARNAVTVGASLAVVSWVAAFLFHRYQHKTWTTVTIIAGLAGAILALAGDSLTRGLSGAVERERLLQQPLLAADISYRLVLDAHEQTGTKSHETNEVLSRLGSKRSWQRHTP